jgi:dethiobiotin synthetase
MKTIFVTATNTDIGKTFATLLLLEEFAKKGYKVGAFKPIETGVKSTPQDGEKLLNKCKELNDSFKNVTIDDIVPITFSLPAAPFVAKKDKDIDFQKIKESFLKLSKLCDVLLIEGAGGLLVPIETNFFMADFIDFFDAVTLLVTSNRLGCINDTLLSTYFLDNIKKPYIWCVNEKYNIEDFEKITLPYYRRRFDDTLYLQRDKKKIVDKLLNF